MNMRRNLTILFVRFVELLIACVACYKLVQIAALSYWITQNMDGFLSRRSLFYPNHIIIVGLCQLSYPEFNAVILSSVLRAQRDIPRRANSRIRSEW